MKYTEFVTHIKTLGFPSVYHHWAVDKAPNLPYLIHFKSGRDDFKADNINYKKVEMVTLEFYSEYPDFQSEEEIEDLLDGLQISYERTEPIYLETEKMYQTSYEFTI